MNRRATWDVPVMCVLLVVLLFGAAWALVDASSDDADDTPPPRFISAPASEYKPGLLADVYRPKGPGPFPAVLLVHGGAFSVGDRGDLGYAGARLANEGILAASIDYTLSGWYDPARSDVADAYRWLVQRDDVKPSRVALIGTSAGCWLSSWFGFSTNKPRALVLVACPGFMPELVSRRGPETLLVHGTADESVPFTFSQTIDEILTQKHVPHDFVVGEGVGHFNALGDDWDAVAALLLPRLER